MTPPPFASGPMHVDHIPGRPIVLGLAGYEFACPGCAFDMGKANKEGKMAESRDIVYKGLHVENRKVLEKPDIKPLVYTIPTHNAWVNVPGRSISIKSAPDSSFNVVCPLCAYYLGNDPSTANYNVIAQGNHIRHTPTPAKEEDATKKEDASTTTNNKDDETTKDNEGETEANKKRTTAVMGNDGVAGINIKGGEIDIEIEAPPVNNPNPTTKPTITPIAPPKADDVVANNYGVAGINLKGTGKVKLVIGKSTI